MNETSSQMENLGEAKVGSPGEEKNKLFFMNVIKISNATVILHSFFVRVGIMALETQTSFYFYDEFKIFLSISDV